MNTYVNTHVTTNMIRNSKQLCSVDRPNCACDVRTKSFSAAAAYEQMQLNCKAGTPFCPQPPPPFTLTAQLPLHIQSCLATRNCWITCASSETLFGSSFSCPFLLVFLRLRLRLRLLQCCVFINFNWLHSKPNFNLQISFSVFHWRKQRNKRKETVMHCQTSLPSGSIRQFW